jgi:hypothetical protein
MPGEMLIYQVLVMRQLLQHGLQTGEPVIAFVRKDVSPEKLKEVYDGINTLSLFHPGCSRLVTVW